MPFQPNIHATYCITCATALTATCKQCGRAFSPTRRERPTLLCNRCNRRFLGLSKPERVALFWSHVNKDGPASTVELGACWVWTGGMMASGYGRFWWNGHDRPSNRVAWEINHGEGPGDMHVLHRCDNRKCVRPDHLFLGTNLDNVRDMLDKGRHWSGKGEANGRARLRSVDIPILRAKHAAGQSIRSLAKSYGMSRTTIQRAINGQTWTHLLTSTNASAEAGNGPVPQANAKAG
ncbi:MAG: HNH endonuclease [Patescibacteria group bacterium]|nr:HNH endonuclease [Patescibacteria group bacterium]